METVCQAFYHISRSIKTRFIQGRLFYTHEPFICALGPLFCALMREEAIFAVCKRCANEGFACICKENIFNQILVKKLFFRCILYGKFCQNDLMKIVEYISKHSCFPNVTNMLQWQLIPSLSGEKISCQKCFWEKRLQNHVGFPGELFLGSVNPNQKIDRIVHIYRFLKFGYLQAECK